jgi:hypothetical protein
VERVLGLLELELEVIELTREPHDGVSRRVDHLVEVLLDVRAGHGVGEAARLLGMRVLDLHEDEAAALHGLDGETTAELRDRGLERRGRLGRVAEEVGIVLEREIAHDRGEHALALHDAVLRLVVLARVPDGAPADHGVGLVAERLDDVRIELEQRLRFVDLRERLRIRERRCATDEDEADDDRPVLSDGANRRHDAVECRLLDLELRGSTGLGLFHQMPRVCARFADSKIKPDDPGRRSQGRVMCQLVAGDASCVRRDVG